MPAQAWLLTKAGKEGVTVVPKVCFVRAVVTRGFLDIQETFCTSSNGIGKSIGT